MDTIVPKSNKVLIDNPLVEEGGVDKLPVTDWSTKELLTQILLALNKIEFHLSIASDIEINEEI